VSESRERAAGITPMPLGRLAAVARAAGTSRVGPRGPCSCRPRGRTSRPASGPAGRRPATAATARQTQRAASRAAPRRPRTTQRHHRHLHCMPEPHGPRRPAAATGALAPPPRAAHSPRVPGPATRRRATWAARRVPQRAAAHRAGPPAAGPAAARGTPRGQCTAGRGSRAAAS